MEQVDLVVRRGKVVRQGGRTYTEGQTFSAPPGKARVWVKIGRAQVDLAGRSAPALEELPKSTAADLREVMREQRGVAVTEATEDADESRDPSADPGENEAAERPASEASALGNVRRRQYRRRDMTAEQA